MPRRRGLRPQLLAAVIRSKATLAFAAERQVVIQTNMGDRDIQIGAYIDQLRGTGRDSAWHALVELGPDAGPAAAAALGTTKDVDVHVALLKLLAEYRAADAVPAITTQLQHPMSDVWRAALDALVTIGDERAVAALTGVRSAAAEDRQPWIDEAISQIRAARRRAG